MRMRVFRFAALLALGASGSWLILLLACQGGGGAAIIRSGVFPNLPLEGTPSGGVPVGGGGGGVDTGDEEMNEDETPPGPGDLPVEGTMLITFVNNASTDAQVALWSSADLFADTGAVQQNNNLRPIGLVGAPETGIDFLPVLRPGDRRQAQLDCVDARSISAAVAEQLVLFAQDACVSPPLRQGIDFECGTTQIELLFIIRDGRAGRLELLAASRIFASCVR